MSKLDLLKWNEKDILRSIEIEKERNERSKIEYGHEDPLANFYIKGFGKMLEDIRKMIIEEEKKI